MPPVQSNYYTCEWTQKHAKSNRKEARIYSVTAGVEASLPFYEEVLSGMDIVVSSKYKTGSGTS